MFASLRLSAFILSNLGLWECIRRKSGIDTYFIPGLTIAIQTSVLFCAGLLNLLPEASYFIYLFGIISLAYFLRKDKKSTFIQHYINSGFLWFAIALLFLCIFLKGQVFTHYDNFSHWSLIVRNMLLTNRYPNFKDTLIQFQDYPPASATYIYFFSKLTSSSEATQMLAQSYMLISSILPLFFFVKNKHMLSVLLISAATIWFLTCNIAITDLLVDTLLPLVAMAGLLYSQIYSKSADCKYAFWSSAFYMIQLVLIKNSGIFFVLLIASSILFNIRNDGKVLYRSLCVSAPLFTLLLWKKHCAYVFHSSEYSKHAMSLANYQSMLGSKSKEDILSIIRNFLDFSLTTKDVLITFLLVMFVALIAFLLSNNKKITTIASTNFFLYLLYQLGMLGMYLFSMPTSEALFLAGSTRYTQTILISIIYLTVVAILTLISETHARKYVSYTISFILIVAFGLYIHFSSAPLRFYRTSSPNRNWIENVKKEYNISEKSSYTVLIPDKDAGYMYYLCRYIFSSENVSTPVVRSQEDLNIINTQYILVYDQENVIIDDWVKQHYPNQYGNRVIIP